MNARRFVLVSLVSVCVSIGALVLGGAAALAAETPTITEESPSNVGSTSATVAAQVNPGGSPTGYLVEYGTSTGYGSSTGEVSLPASVTAVGVQQKLIDLKPGVQYHFRFLARNGTGPVEGADVTFTTPISDGPSASSLPDNRAYEQVSVPGDGEVYVPSPSAGSSEQDISTELPFRPSNDGDSMVYLAEPPGSGKEGNGSQGSTLGNEYLAARSSTGWGVRDITPPGSWFSTSYQTFSSDLSMGVINSLDKAPEFPALTSDVAENPSLIKCGVLYSRVNSSGTYHALFTTTRIPEKCGEISFAGANEGSEGVPGYSHFLFQTPAALIPGVQPVGGEGADLYDSVGGQPHMVNVLPKGELDPGAVFGGHSEGEVPDFSNVISKDGSRAFWTDLSTGEVYVRENDAQPQSPLGAKGECSVPTDACTLPVSFGVAEYWTATKDGRYAFYTEGGELWRFDVQAQTREQLTAPGAEVQGVIGVNETGEEGAYVYVVAGAVLSNGSNTEGREPIAGQPNLYVYRNGGAEPTFIATLSPVDDNLSWSSQLVGDWRPNLGQRTAEITPDGHSVAFLSTQALTGYDNLFEGSPVPEVFVYDLDRSRISCASCARDGEPPVLRGETGVQVSSQPTYMARWISSNGNRVFFDSQQPLAAQDVNQRQDVYEWERNEEGSCRQSADCVYLLSGGSGEDLSYFLGTSETGNDVFFAHRGRLVQQAADGEEIDLYDARVNGGFPETSLACTGTGCQGVPPAPPIFATPSSVTFNGVGNFTQPAHVVGKAKPKSKSPKCKRGLTRKHRKCVKPRSKSKKVKARRSNANRRGQS
jgi:hypothetical protein